MEKSDVVILCGGKGTRLSEETSLKPKPMIEIGGKPILWHIMKIYSYYGFNRFILALGYKGDYIKKYFYDYRVTSSDFTLALDPNCTPEIHNVSEDSSWEITFVDTGQDTLKGARIKRVESYIKTDDFHLTYGDGVASLNINKLHDFHKSHNGIGTVSAVRPPSRFGEMALDNDVVKQFEEKPQLGTGYINGGFFVFKKDFLNRLTPDVNCDFEFGPLQKLAEEGHLRAFRYDGFWQCMDNVREKDFLNKLWDEDKAEWKMWK